MWNRRIAGALLAAAWLAGCGASKPSGLGLFDRRLSACPDRPNCASTQEERFALDPLQYEGTRDQARQRLLEVLESIPAGRVVAVAPHYVRAEFTSTIFRFVDDVEAYLDPGEAVIHLRSASRMGYSDLGVNRERIAEIRRRFREDAEPRGPGRGKETSG